MFQKSFVAAWGDLDLDGRFRNSACLERATDVRLLFFAEHGYTLDEFRKQRLMPLVLKERADYMRSIELLEEYKVALTLAGLAPDGSRFMLRTELVRADGKPAAKLTSTCGWLDLNLRRLTLPPPQLEDILHQLPMSADYQIMPGATK